MLSGFGSNLRTLLQINDIRLYDDRTYRFDSPYQQGNCGGDGTCGTCIVAVLAGKELLNEKVRVEDLALKKQVIHYYVDVYIYTNLCFMLSFSISSTFKIYQIKMK